MTRCDRFMNRGICKVMTRCTCGTISQQSVLAYTFFDGAHNVVLLLISLIVLKSLFPQLSSIHPRHMNHDTHMKVLPGV
jgi:hypothetical protein